MHSIKDTLTIQLDSDCILTKHVSANPKFLAITHRSSAPPALSSKPD